MRVRTMVVLRERAPIGVSADPTSVNQRFVSERPSDPRRPGPHSGDLTDVKPASKIGRPAFALVVFAAIVVLVIVLIFLVH